MSGDLIAIEAIVKRHPLTVRRIVRWAECDPAGVVYAGNFPEYMLSAAHLFRQTVLGARPGQRDFGQSYGTPGKAISMVFLGPLWPGDVFDMEVYVGALRERTSDLLVYAARVDDGSPVFVGRTTSIYVSIDDRKKTIALPDDVRAAFEQYHALTPDVPKLLDQVAR